MRDGSRRSRCHPRSGGERATSHCIRISVGCVASNGGELRVDVSLPKSLALHLLMESFLSKVKNPTSE